MTSSWDSDGVKRSLESGRLGLAGGEASTGARRNTLRLPNGVIAGLLLVVILVIYLLSLARTLILGDPSEFTFVANILGIAHPPGYAFITVVGKLFQMLIPLGAIPWRMHLLSAVAASMAAMFAYGSLRIIASLDGTKNRSLSIWFPPLFAALAIATAADHWQHAIHANPHIITATFLAANLFFLTRWWSQQGEASRRQEVVAGETADTTKATHPSAPADKWLFAFCFSAGLGLTHHPLTLFAFPAYALFIVWVRPNIIRQGRTLIRMVVLALLGLSLWLYFPIRSSMQPDFGPSTMNTLDGFLDHVLARGLSESLPYYGLAEQPDRALVFLTLLQLQYSWPVLLLSVAGLLYLTKRSRRPLLLLYGLAFLGNYAFVISLKAQDIMAYLLGSFLIVGFLSGIGLYGMLNRIPSSTRWGRPFAFILVTGSLGLGPLLQVAHNAPHVSLQGYREGVEYVEAVFDRFDGNGEGAVLLNDWEHMTPLWYVRFVEGKWPKESDVRPELVSAAQTWSGRVFDLLPGGPVFLSNFRRDVVDTGFRLRPYGPFYQVVEPGEDSVPDWMESTALVAGEIELVGFDLPQSQVQPGGYVSLALAFRSPHGSDDFYVPVVEVGEMLFQFTTDSHVVTPDWVPGEVIVERFDFALPHDLPAGVYPVAVGMKNLSTDTLYALHLPAGELTVQNGEGTAWDLTCCLASTPLLANFRQRVGLLEAVAQGDGRRMEAPWFDPVVVQRGDVIRLRLKWISLALAEDSYTVFVHLIDPANRPVVDNLDYTPLGGAAPTHLWFPKWLPGQEMFDPYRLTIPAELPPGRYLIEVGLYEMVGRRRLHISDPQGNLIGDRIILGDVVVSE